VRGIGVIALGLTLCVAASAASARPQLRVTDLKPFTIHGWRFDAGERLRIVVSAGRHTERTLEASVRGTFTLKLRHFAVKRCGQYAVRAYGPSGLRAGVKSPPVLCGADLGP
jgi:hypothetical protein